ncbi:MAG: hypothetical protein JWP14_382 [Frankiales bacterium]|nr:hypothetical protein [Frankiales bacterium]
MTTNQKHLHVTRHAEQRRTERRVPLKPVHDALTLGSAVGTASGWCYIGPDGAHVITDRTGTVVVTVLGRIEAAAHDRDGGGLSRHRRDRPRTRTGQRPPRR